MDRRTPESERIAPPLPYTPLFRARGVSLAPEAEESGAGPVGAGDGAGHLAEAAPFPIVPADDAVLPHCDDVGCSLPDPRQPHAREDGGQWPAGDRKSTRLNSSH